jgi:hypothetical protein
MTAIGKIRQDLSCTSILNGLAVEKRTLEGFGGRGLQITTNSNHKQFLKMLHEW